jgi:hypothetical protein
MMAGGNILTLQKILGHRDIKMTMIYAHLAPDYLGDEMDRLRFGSVASSREVTMAPARCSVGTDTALGTEEARPVSIELTASDKLGNYRILDINIGFSI